MDRKPSKGDSEASRMPGLLNPDQRAAVESRALRLLVLAGAGSGKTHVITRRIIHLVDSGRAAPESILAITFTRNAVREMRNRLLGHTASGGADLSPVTVRTFHSLCYLLLKRHWRWLFDKPFRLVTDSPVSETDPGSGLAGLPTKNDLLLRAVRELLAEDPSFRVRFKRYLWDYMAQAGESDRFGDHDPRTPRYKTLRGEAVRSYAERDIANWLHDRGIGYNYGCRAGAGRKTFLADFHLPELDRYIEVWELGPGSRGERRRKLRRYGRLIGRLVEVERDELLDFPALERRLLRELGLADTDAGEREPTDELGGLEDPETGYPEAVQSFLSLAEEVLDKLKNHSVDPEGLARRAREEKHQRTREFYALFLPVNERYGSILRSEGALDFNDLLLSTAELLRENPGLRDSLRERWTHVLVDEYQDVNTPQVELLRLLAGPSTSLVCVGDDWQSIYGFRGSDVRHILDFESDFPDPEVVSLRVNYRNPLPVVRLANMSIRRSAAYRKKPSLALKRGSHPVSLYRARRLREDGAEWVARLVDDLLENAGYDPEDILVLYRRHSSFRLLADTLRTAGRRVRHETIHAAKGLEAPVVILWAVVGGRAGFPGQWREGGVLRLLTGARTRSRLDEERRIFYVALTRALDRLYIVTERYNQSSFLNRVPESCYEMPRDEPAAAGGDREAPCEGCGTLLPPDYRFCPRCFHGLREEM